MKVLMLHNRYRERGGEDYSSAAEANLLRSAGVDCEFLQVDNRDMRETGLSAAVDAVWSRRAAAQISDIVRSRRIDIVHVQNFFPQFSPAAHWAARSAGAAVVQSLRNYRLACINGQFFRDGRICQDCLGRSPVRGVVYRCYRSSAAASGVVAAMLVAHRMLRTWTNRVDRFIAISNFTRAKMIEAGLPAERIEVKPNFLEAIPPESKSGHENYFVYVGRLSEEKGIRTLIEAWKTLPSAPELKVVGGGPMDGFVREAANALPSVTVLGPRTPSDIIEIVGRAQALIFPSEWYETFGRVAMEAYSVGTPVIASDVGAVAEIVDDGITGLRFRAGSAMDLASKVAAFVGDPAKKTAMRAAARKTFVDRYTAPDNLKMLLGIYERAMARAAQERR
jgi:glycosyltransferase involved in cell wall biosynthesis